MPAMTSPITTSYWCYSCTRFVSVWAEPDTTAGVSCPHCDGGFIEELNDSSTTAELATPASTEIRSVINNRRSVIRRRRSDRRPSFNPVIVLQGGAGEIDESEEGDGTRDRRAFEFYYDDGSGSGLRSLPDSVSEILMGSGFERLLEQLSQIEASTGGISRYGNPPASKSAIESLSRVEISDCHLGAEANCAVCTEVFEAETEAREMPCKHIFHGDCIVPWLSIRNSCPVCRFELPSEPNRLNNEEEHAVGMTIWRLPGGGFAVGRFNAAMRDRERVLPVVLTELDGGGFGNSDGHVHGPRRISWVRSHETLETDGNSASSGTSSGGRLRRMVRGMVSFMRRARPNRNSSSSSSPNSSPNHMDLNTGVESRVLNRSNSVLRRYFRRNRSNRDSVLH